jgi:hypothetical protein
MALRVESFRWTFVVCAIGNRLFGTVVFACRSFERAGRASGSLLVGCRTGGADRGTLLDGDGLRDVGAVEVTGVVCCMLVLTVMPDSVACGRGNLLDGIMILKTESRCYFGFAKPRFSALKILVIINNTNNNTVMTLLLLLETGMVAIGSAFVMVVRSELMPSDSTSELV